MANKINYLAKTSHFHCGIDAETVKNGVLADYEKRGCPTETAEKNFCIELVNPTGINPEVYPLCDVVNADKVVVGRRGHRPFASFCTPIANIKQDKQQLSHRLFVYYNYDKETKGVKVFSAFIVREDAETMKGDYRDIRHAVENPETLTVAQIREFYVNNGYCLALDDAEWAKFKPQENA